MLRNTDQNSSIISGERAAPIFQESFFQIFTRTTFSRRIHPKNSYFE